jgi:hypothetical protein
MNLNMIHRAVVAGVVVASFAGSTGSASAGPPRETDIAPAGKVEAIVSVDSNGYWSGQTVDRRQTWTGMTGNPVDYFGYGWCAPDGTYHVWADKI